MQHNASFHGFRNAISFFFFFFQFKICDIFLIFASNMDCGCSLGSNEHQQSTFLSKNKKHNVYPSKPHFSLFNARFPGIFITRTC